MGFAVSLLCVGVTCGVRESGQGCRKPQPELQLPGSEGQLPCFSHSLSLCVVVELVNRMGWERETLTFWSIGLVILLVSFQPLPFVTWPCTGARPDSSAGRSPLRPFSAGSRRVYVGFGAGSSK